jgi:hypothetical protein
MKLWNWLTKRKIAERSAASFTDEDSVDEKLQNAQTKLAETKQQLPELAKAVASARRVKYRVDSFTAAMNDSMLRRNNHGSP